MELHAALPTECLSSSNDFVWDLHILNSLEHIHPRLEERFGSNVPSQHVRKCVFQLSNLIWELTLCQENKQYIFHEHIHSVV